MRSEPFFGIDPAELKKIRGRDMALRFAFGAAVSIATGVLSLVFNPMAGGMFLAFPTILPATVTLIEKKESTAEVAKDVQGATVGAFGLAVFAVVAGAGLRRTSAVVALGAATAAWLILSGVVYLAVEAVLRHRSRPRPCPKHQPSRVVKKAS